MFLFGKVTNIPGANQFTVPQLAGFPAGSFASAANPWQVMVIVKGTGTGAAPQGQQQPVTAYAPLTGTFTTSAFTSAIAAGDKVVLLNPAYGNTGKLVSGSLFEMEIWSAITPTVAVTTPAGNVALPSLVINGLPTNATIKRAVMNMRWRMTQNTNGAGNSVSGAQNIQAKMDVGGAYITAFAFAGGEIAVPATTREGGSLIQGTSDITAQVPANGAQMDFQWTSALAAQAVLNFVDVQMGVMIYYSVS
jgi:hypothetical protein